MTIYAETPSTYTVFAGHGFPLGDRFPLMGTPHASFWGYVFSIWCGSRKAHHKGAVSGRRARSCSTQLERHGTCNWAGDPDTRALSVRCLPNGHHLIPDGIVADNKIAGVHD